MGVLGFDLSENFDLCDLTDEGEVGDGGTLMVVGGVMSGEGMDTGGESDAHSVMCISAMAAEIRACVLQTTVMN
jgi:hypothetical protein